MRQINRKLLLVWSFCVCLSVWVSAQDNFTGLNDSVINLTCAQTCASLKFKVPHLKSSEDYQLVSIPFKPFAFTSPAATELTDLYDDDDYSGVINLPFPICFYGSTPFNQVVVGSNGLLTFDVSNANCFNAYNIGPSIPNVGGAVQCATLADQSFPYYPRAAIMGAYSDLDPSDSPADMKIEWRFEGVAPFRRFIASWYKVGVYDNSATATCNTNTPATFQIVVNEATAVIDVYIAQKVCTDASSGKAILGIQNWNRDKAVWAPSKNSSVWTAQKEAYRFIPSGTTSRFISAQLINYTTGAVIENAVVTENTPGYKDISFSDRCPAANSEKYIIRTIYSASCDASQIVVNDTITINKSVLPVNYTTTRSNCAVGSGTIEVTVPAGAGVTAPYKYELNPGAIVINSNNPTATFTDLAPGHYSLTVTSAGSCSQTISDIEILSTGTFDVPYVVNPPSCQGASNASIVLSPPAGGGPYTYLINGSPKPTNVITGLPASGPYQIEIRASASCVAFVTVAMIPAGAGTLTGTATSVNSTCAGVNNGSITATATSGSGPYQYSINNGTTWQNGNVFNNLAAGNYNVLIKEGACTSSPIAATITAGTLTGTTAATGTTCAGLANGSIAVTATSGTGPYQYSINNGTTWQNSNVFSNLASGNYNVLIREGLCTSAPIPAAITPGAGLTAFGTSTPASCAGVNNGTISVNVVNGTAPFTVSLNGPATQTLTTPNIAVFSNLGAGNYTITVTDANGCSNASLPLAVAVTAGSGFTATSSATPVSCFGGNDGTITVTPGTGGNSPYSFVLNSSITQSGAANTVFTGLTAGTAYSVLVRDAAGCSFTISNIAVAEPAALAIPAPAIQPPLCSGDNNGSITVNPTGGTQPYTFSLNGGAFQTSNTFKVGAGTYAIRVLDAKNCGAILNNITVTAPPPLSAIISGTNNATCEGGPNGSITVTGVGGSGSYQYSSGGAFQSSNILNVTSGTYTVTVQDANGCMFSIPNVTVGLTNNLTFTPAADPAPICEGSSTTLQITSNATGFSWSPGQAGFIDNASVPNPVVHPSATTVFVVTMTLGACTAQDAVNVQVLPAPVPDAGPDGEICFGQNYQLQAGGGVSYEWTPQRFLSDPFNSSPQVLQPDRTITYALKVVDANNCSSLVSDQITITVIPPIRIKVTPADTVVYAGAQFQLHASSSITGSYTWTPVTGLSNPSVADPLVTAPSVDGATVQYRVTASTASGCKGEGSASVRVYKGPEIYVANAFSPNNDGKNDVFIPIPVGIKQLSYFRVFNRWGQLIFSTNTLQQGWDGRLAGLEQPTGVYTWMVEGITQDGRKITKKGTVTLIR